MSRRAKLAAVALFFVLFGWLYIHTGRLPGGAGQLELRLADAARAALAEKGLDDWAGVDMNGRDALLEGVAPNEAERAAAIAAVKAAAPGRGIARVVDDTDLRMHVSPYAFHARLEGERLTLSGYAPERAVRDAIVARASQAFAGQLDASDIEIASGAPEGSDWLGAVDFAVAQLVRLREGRLEIADARMTITGRAASYRIASEVDRQLHEAPAPFTGSADIDSPPPPAASEPAPAGAETAAEPARPETLAPAACQDALDRVLAGQRLQFGFDDAEVSVESQSLLAAVAEIARRCGRAQLRISGYTDTSGDPDFNVYLSEQRASAVREFLIGQGVDPDALAAKGFGAADPIATNDTAAGRAQNRRIEIDVIESREPEP